MNKKLIPFVALALLGTAATSCGASTNEKATIFYNRQPSTNNVVDKNVMNHTANTYYAGFDAVGGGATQGQMIVDYVKAHAAEMDRNGDGTIGYVLAIGQNSHNDSAARTIGIRKALGTGETADDTTATKEGNLTANDGKTYKIKELACQEMRDSQGNPWSQSKATDMMATWINQYSTQIDLVVSNNDGMAEGMIGQYGGAVIPTFGYDANASTLQLIKQGGSMKGTISQNHHSQVLTCLQLVRNIVDGLTGEDVVTKGFTEKDQYGNQITQAKVNYTAEDKAMLTENGIVTVDNVDDVIEDTLDSGIKQTNAAKKKILWTVYSSTDNFLNQSFVPTVQRYAPFYNYDITFIYGDGTAEGSITDKFVNLSNYDAYVINMVETGSGSLYQDLLDKAA